MNEIWLVRHGETEWSRTGQHTGRTDLPLTDEGRQQALRLASRLRSESFDRVLSSPLQRAMATAQLAGFSDPQPCPDLVEWDYGDLEGRTSHDIHSDYPGWTIWSGPVPKGESIEQVAARAAAALIRCQDGRSALFAHGHFLRVLATQWLGIDPREGRLLGLSTASISILGWEHSTRVIRSWNLGP
jgi:probable phosphoglycerate mutase